MNTKSISVIIPAYNGEKTLERAVDSALSQTYAPAEVILVENGSADGTGELVRRLAGKDGRIVPVFLERNLGVSAARNAGLEKASSDMVTFLDADDFMDETMLECLLRLHEETGCDIAGCGFFEVRDGERSEDAGSSERRILKGEEIIGKAILKGDTRVWSKLFTRKAIEGVRFREDMTIGEDMLFFLEAVQTDTLYCLTKEKKYGYTINPGGAMERPFVPSYMDQIRCWETAGEIIESRFPKVLTDPENRAVLGAHLVTSCVLAAGKIARLPSGEYEKNRTYFHTCRKKTSQYRKIPGAKDRLPGGYQQKVYLLEKMPGLYRLIFGKLRNLKGR